ncbi:UNVERIFIED_ORG: antitoxin HicB [Rhizobium etli]
MKTYRYPVTLEPGDTPGVIVASFADVPEAITEGDDETNAREQASDALGLALLVYVRSGRDLPPPSKGKDLIAPPADVAAKLAVIETFKASGLSRIELGRRLGKDEKQVRRILDPMHGTDIGSLDNALSAMGKRLVIGLEAA